MRRLIEWWHHYRSPHYTTYSQAEIGMWVARSAGLINRSYRSCPCGGWTLRVSR